MKKFQKVLDNYKNSWYNFPVMRVETISTADIKVLQRGAKCGVRKALELLCPWGERYVRVDGGYMVFESETDYETWKNQK